MQLAYTSFLRQESSFNGQRTIPSPRFENIQNCQQNIHPTMESVVLESGSIHN